MPKKDGARTAWDIPGKDKVFEVYRSGKNWIELRKWVDEAYFSNGLSQYLDKDFLHNLRDEDFFGRLWELEVAEWLDKTGLKLVPTNGRGFDFCVETSTGEKIWVEAILARPDDDLKDLQKHVLESEIKAYATPRSETALRYSTALVTKADKIRDKYLGGVAQGDRVLIAVSGYAPGALRPDMDLFLLGAMPINHQVVHFSTDGSPLDPNEERPTHTEEWELTKKSGSRVKKEFLYPGKDFPHVDGILFSEASNLQQLLGTWASNFSELTNTPHIFQCYGREDLPKEFTQKFYYHKFHEGEKMVSLKMEDPEVTST